MASELRSLSQRSRWVLAVACVAIAGLSVSGYLGYQYVEQNPRFCITCHLMDNAFTQWKQSPHHMVNCHACHHQSKLDSLHQVWMSVTQRPTEVVHHPELNHRVCAQCHLSADPQWKRIGETAGHKVHFGQAGIDCLDCHLRGVHEFVRPTEACLVCHAEKAEGPGQKMAFVHCLSCHNFLAQGGDGLSPDRETCLACHRKITVGNETFPDDAPMASLPCATCHKPHEALHPGREVCLTCHADTKPPHHGMAVAEACVRCHHPHQWK